MRIYRHLPQDRTQAMALAIGNFDGLHLGHQALLTKLISEAKRNEITPAVMTFDPHPREFFIPEKAPARLSSLREKLEYFEEAGIEEVFISRFNQQFAAISAQDFMQVILKEALNAQSILVGHDFQFGAKRQGTIETLQAAAFNLIDFPPITVDGQRVSSTLVRNALADGDLQQAEHYLGRPYSISGKVVHGAKRGRELGFPTANVHMRHERPALTGVYAVKLRVGDNAPIDGVANLGVRPTINGVSKLLLEVHLFDFVGDLYNQHVQVRFYHKLRDEMKFSGLDALKAQIAVDVEHAQRFFKN